MCQNVVLCGNWLTLYKAIPGFNPLLKYLQYKSFENTVEKGENAHTSNFSFSHSVFYPSKELSAIFIRLKIIVRKLFQSRLVG